MLNLTLNDSQAKALTAVLGHGMTYQVCTDLGLHGLWEALNEKYDIAGLRNVEAVIERDKWNSDTPVSIADRDPINYIDVS